MHIQLLYFDGCPSHTAALERLHRVLAELGLDLPVQVIAVETDAAAQQWQFHGSPTIRINGHDIDALPAATPYALACRAYRHPDGRITPLPSIDLIRTALLHALELSHLRAAEGSPDGPIDGSLVSVDTISGN